LLISNVLENAAIVTSEADGMPVDSPKRLTIEQAQALFDLIETFQPDWDRGAVLRQMQTTALYSSLEAHEVVSIFINAAATETDRPFGELDFPGHNPWRDRDGGL
jgi:hypothetical protein